MVIRISGLKLKYQLSKLYYQIQILISEVEISNHSLPRIGLMRSSYFLFICLFSPLPDQTSLWESHITVSIGSWSKQQLVKTFGSSRFFLFISS